MKVIHCADLHLDSKMEGLPLEKAKIRREELFLTFERIADFGTKNGVGVIVIAGDFFDSEKIYQKSIERVFYTIKKYRDIDFIYLTGNHEKGALLNEKKEVPKNLKFIQKDWVEFIYENVVIGGVSGDINKAVLSHKFDGEKVNIVVAHGEIISHAGEHNSGYICLPYFKDKGVDYLALGHYHKFMEGVIDNRGRYVYCGCPEGRGFDEIGEKGFVLIEINNSKLAYKFIPFSRRRIGDIGINLNEFNNWLALKDYIVNSVSKIVEEDDLVKIRLFGERTFEIDVDGLYAVLKNKYFHVKIKDESVLNIDYNDFQFDKSIVGEFIETVSKSDMENLTKKRVIMCGIKALNGEEL